MNLISEGFELHRGRQRAVQPINQAKSEEVTSEVASIES
jgi:hypothetical protein